MNKFIKIKQHKNKSVNSTNKHVTIILKQQRHFLIRDEVAVGSDAGEAVQPRLYNDLEVYFRALLDPGQVPLQLVHGVRGDEEGGLLLEDTVDGFRPMVFAVVDGGSFDAGVEGAYWK